jgi:hypothetical protein
LYSDILKSYLPQNLTDLKINSEVLNAEGIEFDNFYNKLSDLILQFSIDTATWALDIYEKDLNIQIDHTKDYDSRRRVIKSKWQGDGKFSSELMKLVCYAFIHGNVSVKYDGTIHITITDIDFIPYDIDTLMIIINELKPAYILIDYKFSTENQSSTNNYIASTLVSARHYILSSDFNFSYAPKGNDNIASKIVSSKNYQLTNDINENFDLNANLVQATTQIQTIKYELS